ncbi:hypothetical protein NQ176_g5313 [Zarea fungicola]|uniref:Uncharacterized protein n=1 Tax=Zarea fungicola TaxID=93591 RepID=A0ACC1NBD9_9HYPO|nr:hypothetical protein NQ176_g5313 [Lecanicillium fungicola]
MMPLVWAVQNANLAATLDASIMISVTAPGLNFADTPDLYLKPANLTGKDVYYAYTYSNRFNVEGPFGISWGLYYKNRNCSQDIYYNEDGNDNDGTISALIWTRKGAQQANIVAAQRSNCSNTENISFNITGTISDYANYSNSTSKMCGILSPTRPALNAGQPCNVKVDDATAASIAASLQATFSHDQCAAGHTASCPATNAAEGQYAQSGKKSRGVLFLAAVSVAVAYM